MNKQDVTKGMKKVLFFWQEICFILFWGYALINSLINHQRAFQDTISVVFFCLSALFLVCLAGQFRWRSICVAHILAVLFGLASLYMILAVLSEMKEVKEAGMAIGEMWFGLCMFLGFLIASITMSLKYLLNKHNELLA